MELNRHNIRKIMGILVIVLLLYFGLLNLGVVRQYMEYFLKIITPFLAGAGLAFILNVPMHWVEKQLTRLFSHKKKPFSKLFLRVSSLMITLLLFIGVVAAVFVLVVPELARSFGVIIDKLPTFFDRVEVMINDLAAKYPAINEYIVNYNIDWDTIGKGVLNYFKTAGGSALSSTMGVATSIFGAVFNGIIAFVFAVNLLIQKEKLAVQSKKVIYAFFPEKTADRTLFICSLSNKTFAHFLSGQGRESVIIGLLFLVTMTLFQFPYALLISILIAVFALIPMFGAFIGCFFGVFFILIVDPIMAVWFVVLFLIIQQIEGNLIYPYVVGGSIGLPSIWVLVAVTIGGNLMGVLGMLVFIPMASVLYVLFREVVNQRLSERKIQAAKLDQ